MSLTLLSTVPFAPAGAAFAEGSDLFISSERAITDNVGSPSDCTASQITNDSASRLAVDAQNDPWAAAAAARGLPNVRPAVLPVPTDPDRVDLSPTPMTVPGSTVTIGVSYRNVPYSDLGGYTPAAIGSAAVGTDPNTGPAPHAYRNPYTPIPADGTLQDCSPYPASLYDTNPLAGIQPARQWNALYGSGSDLDGALFEFSTPVAAFGAWFGDLETRPPASPAYVKLIGAAGTVLWEGPVPASIGAAPTDAECGGTNAATDPLACGNQTTRWIGFVTQPGDPAVAKMLVTVGDDDSCTQAAASQCDGSTEHFSWVGAMIAEPDPLATTTTSTSTSTTTTTTSTTTTIAPTTTVPSTIAPTTTVPSTTTTTTVVAPTSTTTTTIPPEVELPAPGNVDGLHGERRFDPPTPPDVEATRFTNLAFTGPALVDQLLLAGLSLVLLGGAVLRSRRHRP